MKNLKAVTPILHVEDYAAAIEYYCETLGFAVNWSNAEFCYGSIGRGGVEFNVQQMIADADRARTTQITSQYYDFYINAESVDSLAVEYSSKGVEIIFGPADCSYGMRELGIRDRYGYKFCFGQPCGDVPSQ